MTLLNTPLGQSLLSLAAAGLISLIAAVIKLSARMSRVEGKLEMLIDMVTNLGKGDPPDAWRPRRRHTDKGARRRE